MRQIVGVFLCKDEIFVKLCFIGLNYHNFHILIITNLKTKRYLTNFQEQLFGILMSQSIPTGYIPSGNLGENLLERANPGHPGKFFCLIPCPGAKNDGRIPGGGAKFLHTRRNYP